MTEENKTLTQEETLETTEVTETSETTETPEQEIVMKELKKGEYVEAVGRRKTASARVRIFSGKGKKITVNDQDYLKYFKNLIEWKAVMEPLSKGKIDGVEVSAHVQGGGTHAQAEAISLAISRAVTKLSPEYRGILKRIGLLKRDPRKKERKKFGLKAARKASQWAKR